MLNFLDAPVHTRLRRLVSRAFTPQRIAKLEADTTELTRALLGAFTDRGGGDLIAEFSGALASIVVGRMIGIPEDRLADFRHLTDQLLYTGNTSEQKSLMEIAAAIYGEFASVLDARRRSRADDLVSALLDVNDDGGLTDEELLGFCFVLVSGGNDTTNNLIANGWVRLLRNPEQLALLDADRSLLTTAIEEMLRIDPPAESHMRTTTVDAHLHGAVIPAGATVQLLWGAANLDEREFEEPDRFDVTRDGVHHLSLGHGAHYCLGAALARLEARVAFTALLDHAQHLQLVAEPLRVPSPWANAYAAVQLAELGTPPAS